MTRVVKLRSFVRINRSLVAIRLMVLARPTTGGLFSTLSAQSLPLRITVGGEAPCFALPSAQGMTVKQAAHYKVRAPVSQVLAEAKKLK